VPENDAELCGFGSVFILSDGIAKTDLVHADNSALAAYGASSCAIANGRIAIVQES
jgi:hypothetical protein